RTTSAAEYGRLTCFQRGLVSQSFCRAAICSACLLIVVVPVGKARRLTAVLRESSGCRNVTFSVPAPGQCGSVQLVVGRQGDEVGEFTRMGELAEHAHRLRDARLTRQA